MAEHDGDNQKKSRRRRRSKGSSLPSSRSLHRSRSHETSRAEAELESPVVVPDHPLIPQGEPLLIETDEALEAFAEHIRDEGRFAYDTEFIGELSYYPRLCLIQLATTSRIALVDPLENVSLDPIWALIADASINTLVHAASQDLEPVMRLYGQPPMNIFDTQVAAGFVGLSYPLGLSRLIEVMLDIRLGKGLTFTQWDHRPLSDVHARYAADDVRYLPVLQETLSAKLEAMGHLELAEAECRSVARAARQERDADTLYRRIKGMHSLKPRKLAVLRALVKLREEAAKDHDVPPRTLIKDNVLLDLSRNPIDSIDELKKIPGLSKRVGLAYGETIVQTTREALGLPKAELPRLPEFTKETPNEQVLIDALCALAANLCHAKRIAPSLVVNRKDLTHLYHAHRKGRDAGECRLMQDWRREVLGDPLLAFLAGRLEVTMSWDDQAMNAEVRDRS